MKPSQVALSAEGVERKEEEETEPERPLADKATREAESSETRGVTTMPEVSIARSWVSPRSCVTQRLK